MNKNFIRFIYFSGIATSLFLLVSLFSNLTGYGIRIFFCSDTLYFPSIYKDLFIDHYSLKGWHLNPSPNFFPDMIVYFLLMLCSGNFILSSFLFSLIQYFVILFLIHLVFKTFVPGPSLLYESISMLLMTMFILVYTYSKDFMFTFYIVSNGYHTGAFVMALICLLLTIRYLKVPKKQTFFLLFFICSLSILSDRLFIILFSIPVLSVLVFLVKKQFRKEIVKILAINLFSIFTGLGLFHVLNSSGYIFFDLPHRIMDFNNIRSSWNILTRQMWEYLTGANCKSLIIIISLLSFTGTIILLISNLKKEKSYSYLTFYLLFCVVFIPVVFFMPVVNGNYTGYDTLRYNIYVFYLALINTGIILVQLSQRVKKQGRFSVMAASLVSLLIIFTLITAFVSLSPKGIKDYFNYYPNVVKCVDDAAQKEDLEYGVSNYWDAKLVTMFSKQGVRVLPVYDNLEPYDHVANENWFTGKDARINFFIMNHVADTGKYISAIGSEGKRLNTGEAHIIRLPAFRYEEGSFQIKLVK